MSTKMIRLTPFPIKRRAIVKRPVQTLPITQPPDAPIFLKTHGVRSVPGITMSATNTESHLYALIDMMGLSLSGTSMVYCSKASGDN